MKKLFFFFLFITHVSATELTFIGPCDHSFIFKTKMHDAESFTNVGELTIAVLKKFNIPFEGSSQGLVNAFHIPSGNDAVEVLSTDHFRAHGWCYSVDGISPEVYPHEILVDSSTRSIVWYYGYAEFKNGHWITQCAPSATIKPKKLCKQHRGD